MTTKSWLAVAIGLGIGAAFAAASTVTAIYREGHLLSFGLAVLVPVGALACLYRDFGKRVFAALLAVLLVSTATRLSLALGQDPGAVSLVIVVLLGLLLPVALDLMLIDTGTRLAVRRGVAYAALAVFLALFAPLAALRVPHGHREAIAEDAALIREVMQYVQLRDNAIVFDHVDPKRKGELKNRLAVRSEGKTYPLSNAHFESVSQERTVRTRTEKKGSRETLVVSREKQEEMRVVVDLDRPATSKNIVLQSTRGPLTLCEQELTLPGDEKSQDPVS